MNEQLSILYVGSLWEGSTCRMRFDALCELGHRVTAVESRPPERPALALRLVERVANRLGYPIDFARTNEAVAAAAVTQHYDIIWFDCVRMIRPATLALLHRQSPGTRLVSFVMDNPFSSHGVAWSCFKKAVAGYDVHFVVRDADIGRMARCGAPKVVRYHKGYSPAYHRPVPPAPDAERYDTLFCGHYEPKREADIAHLLRNGCRVHVAGHQDWMRGAAWPLVRRHFIDGGFYAGDYAAALSSAAIALCFYSQWNEDVENSRMYEIPACGAFMLAERNAENVRMFAEGREAEFFATPQELLQKTRYYLANPQERSRIAAAGHARSKQSDYSYHGRLRSMLAAVGECAREQGAAWPASSVGGAARKP